MRARKLEKIGLDTAEDGLPKVQHESAAPKGSHGGRSAHILIEPDGHVEAPLALFFSLRSTAACCKIRIIWCTWCEEKFITNMNDLIGSVACANFQAMLCTLRNRKRIV